MDKPTFKDNDATDVKVSVIVPCYNCSDNILHNLKALKEQDFPEPFEIIVVDNNSNDNSCELIGSVENVRLLHETKIQNAAATRNRGAINSKGSIVAFIDADCIAAPDWLSQGVKALEHENVTRIGGRVVIDPLSIQSNTVEILDTLYSFCQRQLIERFQAAMTGNTIIKRTVFEKIGYFNTTFFELEDIEIGQRAAAHGLSIDYAPDCIVFHPARSTFTDIWKKSVRNGRGSFHLCQDNPAWSGRWGWKHLLRPIKMLLTPRKLFWEEVPFLPNELSWLKRMKIQAYCFLGISLPETWGYWKYWLLSINTPQNTDD